MESMTLQEIGSLFQKHFVQELEITGISSDTREIQQGSLFVAITGETFDGNQFIEEAIEKGAVAVIGQRQEAEVSVAYIKVKDSVQALGIIANHYRKKFSIPIIGVTGSVGKTSTREMIYGVLSGFGKTLKTNQNFNNEIGTPTTLLQLEEEHQHGVIEMGMCDFGEIAYLSKMVCPDIGVITNIGVSHIERLKSKEGILNAKMELVEGMSPQGKLVLCGDDPLLWAVRNTYPFQTFTYGVEDETYTVIGKDIVQKGYHTTFTIVYEGKAYLAEIPALGKHNVSNGLAGFLVGVLLGYSCEDCVKYLQNFQPSGMRQKIVEHKGVTLIEDCYNASLDSMKSGISVLGSFKNTGKKIAILADMLELGEYSKEIHLQVGQFLVDENIHMVLTYGTEAENIAVIPKKKGIITAHFLEKEKLLSELLTLCKQGDSLLFKGSRGMKLEDVIQGFYKEF